MTKNSVSVSLPSNMVGRKFKEFHATFLRLGSKCLKDEMTKLAQIEPCAFKEMNYLEDVTDKIRKVTCVEFGIPVQATVNFYH